MNKLNCIMLIDDDEDDNYFHQIILRKMDITHHIQVAQTGLEALDYLEKENAVPDIIFLDINMPGMNGWEFLDEYKKLSAKQRATVIIIMLTTSISPADQEKAERMPEIASFQSKPMTHEMLTDILERHFSDNKNKGV